MGKGKKPSVSSQVNSNGSVKKQGEQASGKKRKIFEIQQALNSDPVDIQTLRKAARTVGGLLTDDIRRKVWPKLLSINVYDLPAKPDKDIREGHKDFNQVLLDVRRSMRRFPKGMRDDQREVLQEQLIDIILCILKRNPPLHYYQGYHDIVVTFLLVVGERMSIAMVEMLSTHHLRAEVGTIFALSWLITWYGHVLTDFRHVLRLYDFFLASHPLMAIYFAAVIVLHRKREVMNCDCDMASIHQLLSQIPQDLPYENLICRAHELFTRFPPSLIAKRAAHQPQKSITMSSFGDFQMATLQQRPDAILQRQTREKIPSDVAAFEESVAPGTNQIVKMAVWAISATLGATALAVAQTALDWAPEFLLQLF
ncbi:TBC1 domain family member 20 isoform X2 [Erpetoichthys calabaricus]|uniref:TBC1 domain family member 20 isoform X2 n=1 Tax=Erpetoichthys calabaricus TaxID=27687 RepID=UPI0022345DB2|nr:TBC1 domain family member 20 isoform X2 [Erpetoichthys calabaricus]